MKFLITFLFAVFLVAGYSQTTNSNTWYKSFDTDHSLEDTVGTLSTTLDTVDTHEWTNRQFKYDWTVFYKIDSLTADSAVTGTLYVEISPYAQPDIWFPVDSLEFTGTPASQKGYFKGTHDGGNLRTWIRTKNDSMRILYQDWFEIYGAPHR